MRVEPRDRPVQLQVQFNPIGEEAVGEAKPYVISEDQVAQAWRLVKAMNAKPLEEVAALVNPAVRGWVAYYGRFYRSECLDQLTYLDLVLARWAKRKFKRFHRNWAAAYRWLGRIATRQRDLFVHWQVGTPPKGWAGRAG